MLGNEKGKFFLSIIIVLACSGFLIWQGIILVNADIEKNASEIKDKKIFSKVYGLREDSLPAETKDYLFSKSKIEKINNYFVYADDDDNMAFTSFFAKLEDFAFQATQKTNSLQMELYQTAVLAPKNANKSAPAKTVEAVSDSRLLKLTLQGNYESLLKFISYLEAMPYYVYTESINVNINGAAEAKKDTLSSDSINLQSILIIKVIRKTNAL